MLRSLLLAIALMIALPAFAEPYPDYTSTTVNDFADLLEPEYEATLVEVLEGLKAEYGVEMVVVTMLTRDAYDPSPSIEAFATGLFNYWGVGNASRNDGIMVLVARDDREMRIELGSGYGSGFDAVAGGIIDDKFLQNFKQDNYRRGIMRGVDEIITRIAVPFSEGDAPVVTSSEGGISRFFPIVLMSFLWLAVVFRRRLGDGLTRMKKCPNCHQRRLHRSRHVTKEREKKEDGAGLEETRCGNCDYYISRPYVISSSRSSSGSSFGGGSSSGGGASGRW